MSPAYATDDHWIPAALFDVLWARIENIDAVDQYHAANASAHGQAMATTGKSAATQSFTRRMHRRAFPKYYVTKASDDG